MSEGYGRQLRETYPVSQPLRVVIPAGSVQSPARKVGGKGEPNKVGDQLSQSEHVEEDAERSESTEAEDTVDLGDLGLRFQVVQSGELGKLPIELLQLAVGDSHGLLGEGVREKLVAGLLSPDLRVLSGRHAGHCGMR